MSASDEKMAAGTTVADRYKVLRVLGEGGMGVVYAAEHMLMRKEVALKVLHGEMCTNPEIVARFEREAIAAAHVEHPNVAGATDFGRLPDGACYLVLELLKGTSLRDEITKGPIPLPRALVILRGIANGVAAAHAKNIVHRDLKPENVMLVDRDGLPDFVKVLDFGIAKMDAAQTPQTTEGKNVVTRVGTIFGTPEYMAPEQAVGDKVDARADMFALGVMFLEMLTGKCPFKGDILTVLRERILMTAPIDMTEIESEDVKALIKRMIQRMPDDRVQSALELLAEIDRLEAEPAGAFPSAQTLNVEEPTKSAMAITTDPKPLPAVNAEPRPKWLVPTAVGASAFGLVVLIVALASSGPAMKGEGHLVVAHHDHHGNVAAKHAPPPPEPSATADPTPTPTEAPAPSDSVAATDDPSADPSASAAPTASHNIVPATNTKPQPPQKSRRRTGPGGIYIPPPNTWFK